MHTQNHAGCGIRASVSRLMGKRDASSPLASLAPEHCAEHPDINTHLSAPPQNAGGLRSAQLDPSFGSTVSSCPGGRDQAQDLALAYAATREICTRRRSAAQAAVVNLCRHREPTSRRRCRTRGSVPIDMSLGEGEPILPVTYYLELRDALARYLLPGVGRADRRGAGAEVRSAWSRTPREISDRPRSRRAPPSHHQPEAGPGDLGTSLRWTSTTPRPSTTPSATSPATLS